MSVSLRTPDSRVRWSGSRASVILSDGHAGIPAGVLSTVAIRDTVAVIGGAGHVGLPLALSFAQAGLDTLIYDIDEEKVDQIGHGIIPFIEEGAAEVLRSVLNTGKIHLSTTADTLDDYEFLVLIVGTPVDEHLNPSFTGIKRALDTCRHKFRPDQILILRSTIYPGMSNFVQRYLDGLGLGTHVAFCPERVAQGVGLRELKEVPQIISAFDTDVLERVHRLFALVARECIAMKPQEAELCKLMTNAWRYIQFATVNQFYMIATEHGLDFERILHGCRYKYDRMAGMPGPGLSAGPCLRKDTLQLAAFSNDRFILGHAAMMINESLPAHLVKLAANEVDLAETTTGILGMAFKADIDDPRDSLSYKLRKLLLVASREVLCTDPYVRDSSLVDLATVIERADVLFIATPHSSYRTVAIPEEKVLIDVWGVCGRAETDERKGLEGPERHGK